MKPHKINKNLKAKANRNTKVAGPGAAVTFVFDMSSRAAQQWRGTENLGFDGDITVSPEDVRAALVAHKDLEIQCHVDVLDLSIASYYNVAQVHEAGVITHVTIPSDDLQALFQGQDVHDDDVDTALDIHIAGQDPVHENAVTSAGWVRSQAPATVDFGLSVYIESAYYHTSTLCSAVMETSEELRAAYDILDEPEEDDEDLGHDNEHNASTKTGSTMSIQVRNKNLRVAADDLGDSKQPAMRPIFRKVAPQLVKPFQKAMRTVPSTTKKKLIQTYFGKVKLQGDVTSKKNQKLLRDTLVQAVKRDLGWMEFVAEQILDASATELAAVLGGTERAASTKRTAAHMVPEYYNGVMYYIPDLDAAMDYYPANEFSRAEVAKLAEDHGLANDPKVDTAKGWFVRLSAPGYLDTTDWEGPFGSENEAKAHAKKSFGVDPETGMEVDAATKTAGIDSIYEGGYPSSESDFDGIEFPVTFKTMGQSDSWYRLEAVAREAGFSDGSTITLDSAEDAIQLFSDLSAEADEYEAQMDSQMHEDFEEASAEDEDVEDDGSWYDTNYSEYHSDDHEPAAILARQLGLD